MTNKATKYGLMTIAAVLLVALAFAGAASAENVAPESFTGTIQVNGSVNGEWPTLDQSVSVKDGYYIKNESNWRYVVESVNTGETTYNSANLVLTNDILFTSEVPSLGNSSAKKFQGHIYGNGYKIVNFTQSGAEAHGLICYAGDGCALNYVQMWDCNIASTASDVGGFIGFPDCGSGGGDMSIWGCSLKFSNVTTTSTNLGGFTGYVRNTNLLINASCIDRVYLSGSFTGGFCVQATSLVNITDSWINGSQLINGSGCLISSLYTDSIMTNVTVKECDLRAPNKIVANVGGLFGYVGACPTLDGCRVENCSIGFPSGDRNMGALMGYPSCIFKGNQTWARYCWINNGSDSRSSKNGSIGSLIGGQGSVIIQDVAPQHYMVNSPQSPTHNEAIAGIDNSFDGNTSDGVGSLIGKGLLIAGKDYGYGSAKHVTYDANDATSGTAPAKQTYAPSSTATVADKGSLAKFGYDFNGWNVGSSSGALVLPGETFTISADTTLYANWSLAKYSIAYNLDNGTNAAANPRSYNITTPEIILEPASKKGYVFENWYNSSVFGDASRNNTIPAGSTGDKVFYANWTMNTTNVIASDNKASFGNDNVTATHSTTGNVFQVLLEDVSNVTNTTVSFTADNTSVGTIPVYDGYAKDEITIFGLNATAVGKAKINVTVTFANETTATAKKDMVRFFHYVGSEWEPLNSTIASQTNEKVLYTVETTSFSPFGIGIFTPSIYTVHFDANGGVGSMADMTFTYDEAPRALSANTFQRYNSNFLYWTTADGTRYTDKQLVQNLTTVNGTTVVMKAQWEGYSTGGSSSGSTYMGSSSASYTPTQQPTVKPTVAPTAAPTEKPATPTVIATEKPATQATQSSPAPFVGILVGLGAVAVLLRLRK